MVRALQGAGAGAGKSRRRIRRPRRDLAKINVDEEQFIAAQFQVRSIPTVYAMFQGQPVADLTNARSESQLQGRSSTSCSPNCRSRPATRQPAQDVAPLLAMAEEVLAAGDGERAVNIFAQIVEIAPGQCPGECRSGPRA